MRTVRQQRGAEAEARVADHLRRLGWRVVAANLRVGRDEVDLLAIDPGPPPVLVVVEVRSLRTTAFGTPEERVDAHKVRCLYRALAAVSRAGALPDGGRVPRLPGRVDLLVVDARAGRSELRHLRGLMPP